MRLQQFQNNYLYEGLDRSATQSMMLWESAGFKLKEAALTADQIQQIFQSVEQGATDAGSNRTLLGKGKDATMAVNKAWEDLKTKVQDSGPIKNVDNAYDSAVAKIEAGLGGPDNMLSKVIMRYRKFAKEHPIAQSLIYGALIAAAGISGAGLGGAAILGLFKLVDKLLQGEKFSSAAYAGAKTGAMAYGASKLGDLIKGKPDEIADKMSKGLPDKIPVDAVAQTVVGGVRQQAQAVAQKAIEDAIASGTPAEATSQLADVAAQAIEKFGTNVVGTLNPQTLEIMAEKAAMIAAKAAGAVGVESTVITGKKLSEGQVYMIFNRVSAQQQLTEGPMDFIKGAAAKGMSKLKTVGKNLTTKVTADKLNSAWKKAGSPLDSEEVAKVITAAGVGDDIVKSVYTDLKIPTAGSAVDPAAMPDTELDKLIDQLNTKQKKEIVKYLQQQLRAA
jgi:hypothetical protein